MYVAVWNKWKSGEELARIAESMYVASNVRIVGDHSIEFDIQSIDDWEDVMYGPELRSLGNVYLRDYKEFED